MTSDQKEHAIDKKDLKIRISRFFIKNGFLASTELMEVLLQEQDPLEKSAQILENIKDKAASIAVITTKDVPKGILSSQVDSSNSKATSIKQDTDQASSMPPNMDITVEIPLTRTRPPWTVQVIDHWSPHGDASTRLTPEDVQELLKTHEHAVAREYLRLIRDISTEEDGTTIEVAIVLQKNQDQDELRVLLELPLKEELMECTIKTTSTSTEEFQWLAHFPIHGLLAIKIDEVGNEKIIKVVKPPIVDSPPHVTPTSSRLSPRQELSSQGDEYLLLISLPSTSSLADPAMNKILAFISGKTQLQYQNDSHQRIMISRDHVTALFLFLNPIVKAVTSRQMTVMVDPSIKEGLNTVIKLVEALSTEHVDCSFNIYLHLPSLYWASQIIPIPATSFPQSSNLPEFVHVLTSPSMLEVIRREFDSFNDEKPVNPRKKTRLLTYLEPMRLSSPEMLKYMVELRHFHVLSPKIIHVPPNSHNACVFKSLPDIIIHNLGHNPNVIDHTGVKMIKVPAPETPILINLERRSVHHSQFLEKKTKNGFSSD